jgi:predicted nuclease with TOPRIM domain
VAIAKAQAEESLQKAHENLQMQSEELQVQSEEIQSQNEELQVQSGKLREVYENLQVSEIRYLGLFEMVQEAFFINRLIYDEQGKVIDWIFEDLNPAGFNLLGVKGKRGSEVLGCERAAFHFPMIERAKLLNKVVTFQYYSPYADKELLTSYVVNDDLLITV